MGPSLWSLQLNKNATRVCQSTQYPEAGVGFAQLQSDQMKIHLVRFMVDIVGEGLPLKH